MYRDYELSVVSKVASNKRLQLIMLKITRYLFV